MSDELIWYCRQCGKVMKVQPKRVLKVRCTCTNPVMPLQPTRVIS